MKYFLSFLFAFSTLHAQTPFSTDSALSNLKTLSVTIGARPMGSPAEQRALEFGCTKFREFKLDDVHIMKMRVARNFVTGSLTNTNSGIAIGVLRGKTNRIIVIGGHIDSAEPEVPGTNDDGSGAASVIELARVLSNEQLQSTMVFCLFGGEEAGLCGSKHFVKEFTQLDSVALMMELDMANGSKELIPTMEAESGSAPTWLVKAAYEEFDKLGYSGLNYYTHFFTSMSILPGGGVSSDEEPFLENNIPAIDFTSDIDDPIHTPQDDFEHFKPAGLKRSGDLAYKLVHRFDNGVPEEKTGNYYLWQIGGHVFFFPLWLLSAFVITSIILAVFAVIMVRKRRIEVERKKRPIVPALKLFLFALLIQACVWFSENLVGLIKGIRYPWFANPEGYFILGFLAALIGIALSLKLAAKINLSRDPYRWFLRSVVFLLIFISLMSLTNMKVTIYPSAALFLLSLAMLVRRPWMKLMFWIVSPYFMFRLIFSEGYIFVARMSAFHSTQPIWMYFVLHLFFILFFALWSFPFMLGFAAIYFDSKVDLLRLKKLLTRTGMITIISAFVVCVLVLAYTVPSYSDVWRQNISIDQSMDLNTGECKIFLRSSEYLKNINVHFAEKDTNISTWEREILLKKFKYNNTPWIQVERKLKTYSDSITTFDIMTKIRFKYRPEKFSISYRSGKNTIKDVSGLFAANNTGHSISMKWESFQDTSLIIPINFKTAKSDSVFEIIEAKFIEPIEPVRIERELTNIIPRTTLRRTENITPQH